VTALADILLILAAVAPRVPWQSLAMLGAACLAWLAWLDHDGATS